jgi:hypothetical protein
MSNGSDKEGKANESDKELHEIQKFLNEEFTPSLNRLAALRDKIFTENKESNCSITLVSIGGKIACHVEGWDSERIMQIAENAPIYVTMFAIYKAQAVESAKAEQAFMNASDIKPH